VSEAIFFPEFFVLATAAARTLLVRNATAGTIDRVKIREWSIQKLGRLLSRCARKTGPANTAVIVLRTTLMSLNKVVTNAAYSSL
jgi:hypothetical protein